MILLRGHKILKVYILINRASKIYQAKTDKLQGEKSKSTKIVRDFDTYLTVTERTSIRKIKAVSDLGGHYQYT